jgi:hypothetical protein
MKVKIKTHNGELSYLTPEKEYEVIESNSGYFVIEADVPGTALCRMSDCPHLNGGSWEIVTESLTSHV